MFNIDRQHTKNKIEGLSCPLFVLSSLHAFLRQIPGITSCDNDTDSCRTTTADACRTFTPIWEQILSKKSSYPRIVTNTNYTLDIVFMHLNNISIYVYNTTFHSAGLNIESNVGVRSKVNLDKELYFLWEI